MVIFISRDKTKRYFTPVPVQPHSCVVHFRRMYTLPSPRIASLRHDMTLKCCDCPASSQSSAVISPSEPPHVPFIAKYYNLHRFTLKKSVCTAIGETQTHPRTFFLKEVHPLKLPSSSPEIWAAYVVAKSFERGLKSK